MRLIDTQGLITAKQGFRFPDENDPADGQPRDDANSATQTNDGDEQTSKQANKQTSKHTDENFYLRVGVALICRNKE